MEVKLSIDLLYSLFASIVICAPGAKLNHVMVRYLQHGVFGTMDFLLSQNPRQPCSSNVLRFSGKKMWCIKFASDLTGEIKYREIIFLFYSIPHQVLIDISRHDCSNP